MLPCLACVHTSSGIPLLNIHTKRRQKIKESKLHRWFLEHTWRRNPTHLNHSRLTKQIHFCNRLMSKAKSAYYTDIIKGNSKDQRSPWKAFNKILQRQPVRLLPGYHIKKHLFLFPIPMLGVDTKPAAAARNLGIYFDQNFNFRNHISQVCRSCYYHIWDIRQI